ncbi:MAG TPA: hypothetical protein VFK57_01420 [Vicinamibacterales bacterium]|nr:hypothetical protein [Vicinamibacterales bacterium]
MNKFGDIDDLDLALALRRLADAVDVPPIDLRREAALMAAFDAAQGRVEPQRGRRLACWGMAGLATAAALLIAVGLAPVRAGRHGTPQGGSLAMHEPLSSSLRGAPLEPEPPSEFVIVPGAAALPPMESGELVRMDVPVSLLAAFGVVPPANPVARVRADLIVGQDGLPRAVRLVD